MAFWDATLRTIVYFKSEPAEGYPGWERIDCGCSNGLEWGGEEPRECRNCGGSGFIFHHIKSGVLALYPGGPLCGKL